MFDVTAFLIRWARSGATGKGIKISAEQQQYLDATFNVGAGLAAEASRVQREKWLEKQSNFTRVANTDLAGMQRQMGHSEAPSYKSSGMTRKADGKEAVQRALLTCGRQSSS